jgi:hypothetical protein
MCDPVTIGLTVASAAVTMAGQYAQGQGAYTNAKYEEAAAKANAGYAAQQAKDSNELTGQEAARRYREAGQLEGQQQAAMAANGIDTTFGSAVDVQRDSKKIASEDVQNIYTQGARRSMGYLVDAYDYRLKADAAKSAASGAQWATGIGMVSTALGAASQMNKMKTMSSPNFNYNFGGG